MNTKNVSRLVAIHVMGTTQEECASVQIPDYAEQWSATPFIQERIDKLGLVDEYCRALTCTRNRIFVNEPLPNCNPSRVIDWLMIKATPLQRSLAALVAVGFDIKPLLKEAGYPKLAREDK